MHRLVPVVLFLTVSVWASSSSFSAEQIVRLDNVTLSLNSRYDEDSYRNCTDFDDPFYQRCCTEGVVIPGDCYPVCHKIGQWCRLSVKECCDGVPCISGRCLELEPGINFVVVAKVALAAALIITMVAVISICYKGFIRPRCRSCFGPPPEGDNESMSSVRRYVRQLMDNRPPRYEFQPEKPPSYEECVGGSASGASSLSDPPPYSVAVNLSEESLEQNNACALPPLYVMGEGASLSQQGQDDLLSIPLNVQCFHIQDSASISSAGDIFVTSPVSDMDDYVAFISESESADSISYRQLSHSDTPTRMETPPLEQIGIDNATFVPDEETQQTKPTTEPLER